SRSKNASALWSLGNIAKPSSGVNGGPASQTQGRGMRAPVPDVLQVGTRYRQQCPAPLTDQAKGDDRGPGLWRRGRNGIPLTARDRGGPARDRDGGSYSGGLGRE